jgi:hypothetical protein
VQHFRELGFRHVPNVAAFDADRSYVGGPLPQSALFDVPNPNTAQLIAAVQERYDISVRTSRDRFLSTDSHFSDSFLHGIRFACADHRCNLWGFVLRFPLLRLSLPTY